MSTSNPKWSSDPDAILEVALTHGDLDAEFADRFLERVALWAWQQQPGARERLRDLLKAPRASRPPLALVELAATLARVNEWRAKGETDTVAFAKVGETMATSPKNVASRAKRAEKLLAEGELAEWAAVLRKPQKSK